MKEITNLKLELKELIVFIYKNKLLAEALDSWVLNSDH